MYIPEFICGVVFTLAVEVVALAILIVKRSRSRKR